MRTTGVSIYSLNNIGIMSYIDNEILERLIGTMVEGFARIEKKLDQMNRLKECMNYLASEIQSFLLQRGKNVVNNK